MYINEWECVFWCVVFGIAVGIAVYIPGHLEETDRQRRTKLLIERIQYVTKSTSTEKLFSQLSNYFTEKTWGTEGIRWSLISIDENAKILVAELKFQESVSNATSLAALTVPIGDSAVSLINSQPAETRARYVLLKINVLQSGSFMIVKFCWDFRFSEQRHPHQALPKSLLLICEDVWNFLDHRATTD